MLHYLVQQVVIEYTSLLDIAICKTFIARCVIKEGTDEIAYYAAIK